MKCSICGYSKKPNGVFSVATLGRTLGRRYYIPLCNVLVDAENSDTIGIFGEYEKLTVLTKKSNMQKVLIQELTGEFAYDITDSVSVDKGNIVISGDLIHKIETEAQPKHDTSEPGVILSIN